MFLRSNLVYFGFPKCGSSWLRWALNLRWGEAFDPFDWEASLPSFCHCKPARFVQHFNLDLNTAEAFTVIRNPFARLVSCWKWAACDALPANRMCGQEMGRDGRTSTGRDLSFEEFVRRIYEHRANLAALPLCWMFLPLEAYFEGVDLDKVRVFRLENPAELVHWLRCRGVRVRNKVVNATRHDHYSTYYTPELRAMVEEVYAFELERFGYAFPPTSTAPAAPDQPSAAASAN